MRRCESGSRLLVLAGEASGDRLAAPVLEELQARALRAGVELTVRGIAGPRCDAAGLHPIGPRVDLAAVGLLDPIRKAGKLARAVAALLADVLIHPYDAALLVNFSEVAGAAGKALRRFGTKVLWLAPPQVWAWRCRRVRTLRTSADRFALLLPFEEPLWRGAGNDAHFVGHPAADAESLSRAAARAELGLDHAARAGLVLLGSRGGEVRRHAEPFCEAMGRLVREGSLDEGVVLVAPNLERTEADRAHRSARAHALRSVCAHPHDGAARHARAFDVALSASGTACLELGLEAVPTVCAYRVDPLTYTIASRMVRTPHVALPNVILAERLMPELLQAQASPGKLARELRGLLGEPRETFSTGASRLRELLLAPGGGFAAGVARLLTPWLRLPYDPLTSRQAP